MHVPAGRGILALAVIKAEAEHPVAAAGIVLEAVVVADGAGHRRGAFTADGAPPFGRDALGTFRLDDAAGQAAPREAGGCPLGDLGNNADRLGTRQQEGWTGSYMQSYASSIGGGTSEIQLNIIGERVLGLPR